MLVSMAGRLDLQPWSVGGHAAGPVATLALLPSRCQRADNRGWLTSDGLVTLCPRARIALLLLWWMLQGGGCPLHPGSLPTACPV